MSKTVRFLTLFCIVALFASVAAVTAQEPKNHRLVLQVSSEDPETMNLALNNAMNAKRYYDGKGETLTVEIVTYGAGITMLRSDNSPVKDRIAEVRTGIPTITFSMCANSKAGAERREGREITPLPGIQIVPAGIVRVIELQEQGYSYARP
jgi:intracellular sulfur oxidation DsrE/DsrF family protein